MVQILVNSVDVTSQIEQNSLQVSQRITNEVDSASFSILKTPKHSLVPAYGDEVIIYDGTTKVFAGTVVTVSQAPLSRANGITFDVRCVDWGYTIDKKLISRTYENKTIAYIIADIISAYAPGFTCNNVTSPYPIEKIVFNQLPFSTCIKRLANIMNYNWYIDEDKDIHFFEKYTNLAPEDLTDTAGNYVFKTLKRTTDGSQVANRIKVRGGVYDGSTYTDIITVKGNDSKSFALPYLFSNLTIELNTGAGFVSKTVGIDFADDFSSKDVLYNYQEKNIRFENALTDGNKIRFSGNPKTPVFAIAEDPASIAAYGKIEKLLREDAIVSNAVARKRAAAELYAYSEPVVDAKFRTYTPGLRAGMVVRVQSDLQSFDDDLIIKTLNFKMRDHESFLYDVELVSTRRYSFLALLQKLLEPQPRDTDESEVSEEIFTDTQSVTIEEATEMVAAFDDEAQAQVNENYELNPLGANTNAEYVLAEYVPTGQNDPKRPGRLGISLVAY